MAIVIIPYFLLASSIIILTFTDMTKKQIESKRKELGLILRTEREERKLKITEAASLIGTTHQSLTSLEEGKHFNFCFAVKVCSYYGLDLKIIKP